MKPYFSKLLTEKERRGSRNRSKKTGARLRYIPDHDYDEQPKRLPVSRRRQYGYSSKELSDVLRPLWGCLFKNLGRHWDEVYSELTASMDRRSVSGRHVFQHLWDYVQKNTFIGSDGEVWEYSRGGTPGPVFTYQSLGGFYVHPETKLLCFLPHVPYNWRKGKKPEEIERIDLVDQTYYARINDIWFHCTFAKVERESFMGRSPWNARPEEIILKKRQVGKKELRKRVFPLLQRVTKS